MASKYEKCDTFHDAGETPDWVKKFFEPADNDPEPFG